jgi:hypothetical protein
MIRRRSVKEGCKRGNVRLDAFSPEKRVFNARRRARPSIG